MSWTDTNAEPAFPPLLNGRRVIPGQSLRAAAVMGAQDGSLGAGDVLWDGNPARVDLAIVLEPEVNLARAAQVLPVAMVAAGDCIGALAPPQVGVMFRWPGTILVNGAHAGWLKLIASATDGAEVPEWLIVQTSLRMRQAADDAEPGKTPDTTTLADEGCEELSNVDVMESFSRHFLTWLHIWQNDGFAPAHAVWAQRADFTRGDTHSDGAAGAIGLDEDGGLLVRQPDGTVAVRSLLEIVETEPVQA